MLGFTNFVIIRLMKKRIYLVVVVIIAVILVGWFWSRENNVKNFAECVAAGNPVMESYPRQCRVNGETFKEDIGNELEKDNLIRLSVPRPNTSIESPLIVKGFARGNWFFEASFPIFIVDWDGKIIGQGIATAEAPWMTAEFVPFTATVKFDKSQIQGNYSNHGTLILKKDNPSGLPENDDALEVPVILK